MLLHDVCRFLDAFAPPYLAEDWDNVGLLVGNPTRPVRKIMTCLTITPGSAAEAVREQADLIVTHHPLPFRPLKRLTTETVPGRLLLQLIEASIAIHSPHTAFDSAAAGINQRLAEGIGLRNIGPLVPCTEAGPPSAADELGAGRYGQLAKSQPLAEIAEALKMQLKVAGLHRVGPAQQPVHQIGVACGAAGEFLGAARERGCDLLITGETTFHTCLEAEATGVALLLPGHYASERFAVEQLAEVLGTEFAELEIWASQDEQDPLQWV